MTEAMPFLQKTILLSYDPRPFGRGIDRRWKPGIIKSTEGRCQQTGPLALLQEVTVKLGSFLGGYFFLWLTWMIRAMMFTIKIPS